MPQSEKEALAAVKEWIGETIDHKVSPTFYGHIKINFQAGKVSVIEVNETLKLDHARHDDKRGG